MRKTMLQYPVPVYPERIEEVSDTDQLIPYARRALQRTSGRGELGTIKPGEKVLLVAPPGQDRLVLEAIMHGFNEKGIEVASIGEEEVAGIPREKLSKQNQREGWAEVYWRDEIVEILGLEKRTLIEVKWYLEGFLIVILSMFISTIKSLWAQEDGVFTESLWGSMVQSSAGRGCMIVLKLSKAK